MSQQTTTEVLASHPAPEKSKINRKTWTALTAGALAVGAIAGIGAGEVVHRQDVSSFAHSQSLKNQMAEVAQAEDDAVSNAKTLAFDYENALNNNYETSYTVPMETLHGVVSAPKPLLVNGQEKGGGPTPSYKNAILLSTLNPNAKPDPEGNYLVGAWIGIIGNDTPNHVVVTALPFDATTMTYKPYDPEHPIDSISAYVSASDQSSQVFGEDPLGNKTLSNPDNTPYIVGESVGMK